MTTTWHSYTLAICRRCGDAITLLDYPRVCACGRTEAARDEATGDPVVETAVGASLVSFPGDSLTTAIGDAEDTHATTQGHGGNRGITRAHVTLVAPTESS